jgi:hypothetical protein
MRTYRGGSQRHEPQSTSNPRRVDPRDRCIYLLLHVRIKTMVNSIVLVIFSYSACGEAMREDPFRDSMFDVSLSS